MANISRGNTPRQEPWSTEDIVEVVHTAITDLMEADLEKAGLDPKYATNPEAAVMFNLVHWHIGQGQDGRQLVADLNRERTRDDLVSGLDELNAYITDHAQDFLVWGQLPNHHASPVIEVVPNPFYLDRLAYLCLAVAAEFTDRGRNALATLRKFNLEVDGTRGDLDNGWLESSLAWEHLTSAVHAIEQIMAHPLAGEPKREDTIALKLYPLDVVRSTTARGVCGHCQKMTAMVSPFCEHCGLQWREIIPAHDEPLDGVGAPDERIDRLPDDHNLDPERALRNDAVRDAISIRPPETRMAGDLKLHFDHSGNLTEIERPLDRNLGTWERIVIGEERFAKMLNWPAVMKAVGRYNAEHAHGEIVANCQVCGADIHDTGHRDLTCPNGCDHLKGDRCTCPSCTNIVPAIFNHCPNCGYILINAEIFVD